MYDAEQIVRLLGLARHPEGGWFRETWRDRPDKGGRGAGTAIYFLLGAGEESRWHRVDAAELWHFYAGGPVELRVSEDGRSVEEHDLGPDLEARQRPQRVVPAGAWQSALAPGGWALVGCTVSPALLPPSLRPPGVRAGRGEPPPAGQ